VVGIVRHPDPTPASTAPSESGTCAATAGTRSMGSRSATGSSASGTDSGRR
jgi:hypothetical protein